MSKLGLREKHSPAVPQDEQRGGTALDFKQFLSLLLVIERLERARCTTAHETGVSEVDGRAENGKDCSFHPILRAALPLARSNLSITVDDKGKGLRAV